MKYLLDTCLISELTKPSPNAGVTDWLKAEAEERLFLSVVTLGELQAGVARLSDSKRKVDLARWLNDDIIRRFSTRLLNVDTDVALVWGQKRGESTATGQPLPVADGLIAATAIAHGLTVVTRNTADLQRCGALTLNPWS